MLPSLRQRVGARVRTATPYDIVCWVAWIALPLAGVIWIGLRYNKNWYYYDEWSMIDRSMGSWHGLLDGHQGHLAVENYLIYRAQRAWFGLENHRLVYLGFLASLAAFQVSVAALLRRLGLPTLLALLAGTMITYFGPGTQNWSWEFQQNINFALALCFVASVIALREAKAQRSAIAIAAVLVLAVTADSGLAILGLVFVGVLLAVLWPRRLAVLAVVPAVMAHLAWFAFGPPGVYGDASLGKMWTFAWRLFALSAGGLIGGGETPSSVGQLPTGHSLPISGVSVGLLVLGFAAACVWFGFRRGRLTRPIVAPLIGGLAAAAVGVSALAKTRAFLISPSQFSGSRYPQWIAVFILLAVAPVIAASLRPADRRTARAFGAVAGIALIAIFLVNLGQWRPARDLNEAWSAGAKSEVQQSIRVLSEGCRSGARISREAQPSPDLDPQISVRLLQALLADGALKPEFGVPASRAVRDRICLPVDSG